MFLCRTQNKIFKRDKGDLKEFVLCCCVCSWGWGGMIMACWFGEMIPGLFFVSNTGLAFVWSQCHLNMFVNFFSFVLATHGFV